MTNGLYLIYEALSRARTCRPQDNEDYSASHLHPAHPLRETPAE